MLNEDFLQSYRFLFFHSYIINDWSVVGKNRLIPESSPKLKHEQIANPPSLWINF